jgi:hypothetical protein
MTDVDHVTLGVHCEHPQTRRKACIQQCSPSMDQRVKTFMPRLLPIFLVCAFAACQDTGIEVPPELPLRILLNAPDTVRVDGRTLTLSTSLWRDLMPSTDDHGSPLTAILYVETADSANFPASISADAVWIVRGDEVWKGFCAKEAPPPGEQRPNRLWRIARNGPGWPVDLPVEVIVRLLVANGSSRLLRASHQRINGAY